jgi:hypothetical protein
MVVVTCLAVLVRTIGIFSGLIVFELPYNLAVVAVAVWFVVLKIQLAHRRYLLHLGRGGGGMLNVVHM